MENQIYDKVLDELLNVVPSGWKKIAFYAEYEDGSYSMKYYVDMGNGKFQDCFELATEKEIVRTFIKIDKILQAERKKLSGKDIWSVITLIFNENGKVKVSFDYQNTQDNSIEYFENWKKKYL